MVKFYTISFYKTISGKGVVEEFIDSLDETTQVRIRNAIRLLKEYGLTLLSSQKIKKLHKNPAIFELRISGEIQVRLLFFKYDDEAFLVTHGFVKKTQKTPQKELQLAIKRAKEFS